MAPHFSIIIPAYNAERVILRALESVQRQTYVDYDVTVVDDGSQDGTIACLQRWVQAHPGIPLQLVTQSHRGIGAARNLGIQRAAGAWVAFLDADDEWQPKKLERMAAFLERSADADLVCHDEWLVEEGRRVRQLAYGPHTRYEALLFKGNCLSTSAAVVRRSSLMRVGGFSEDMRFNGLEDYDLWLRLAQTGCRLRYLHEPLGCYHVHAHGITADVAQHCEHGLNVLDAHFHRWPTHDRYHRSLMRRRRAALWRGAGRALVRRGDYQHARAFLWHALQEDPLSWKAWLLTAASVVGVTG